MTQKLYGLRLREDLPGFGKAGQAICHRPMMKFGLYCGPDLQWAVRTGTEDLYDQMQYIQRVLRLDEASLEVYEWVTN